MVEELGWRARGSIESAYTARTVAREHQRAQRGEAAKSRGDGALEHVVREVEVREVAHSAPARWDGARQTARAQRQLVELSQASERRRQRAVQFVAVERAGAAVGERAVSTVERATIGALEAYSW